MLKNEWIQAILKVFLHKRLAVDLEVYGSMGIKKKAIWKIPKIYEILIEEVCCLN
jgi:hypothetical protein